MTDHATTLWTLTRGEEDEAVSCLVRLTPYGIEVDITVDGVVVVTRAFDHDTEAFAWAGSKRAAREAQGWTAIDLPPAPKV